MKAPRRRRPQAFSAGVLKTVFPGPKSLFFHKPEDGWIPRPVAYGYALSHDLHSPGIKNLIPLD
ncbi:MAG: hypothetical protein LR011_10690 [Verrucomicrobia bacterium]|nr:hypothetical protein [Verrucomicrobiota bacterium]